MRKPESLDSGVQADSPPYGANTASAPTATQTPCPDESARPYHPKRLVATQAAERASFGARCPQVWRKRERVTKLRAYPVAPVSGASSPRSWVMAPQAGHGVRTAASWRSGSLACPLRAACSSSGGATPSPVRRALACRREQDSWTPPASLLPTFRSIPLPRTQAPPHSVRIAFKPPGLPADA